METPLGNFHQRRTITKRSKSKKNINNPIKVVYISNPMKMHASPSEFRALVQKFTGQDADTSKLSETEDADHISSTAIKVDDEAHSEDDQLQVIQEYFNRDVDLPFDDNFLDYEDSYSTQMLENLSGISFSSILLESAYMDMVRSLDAV